MQMKYEWLAKRELGITQVILSDTDYPEYDAFEKSVSKYFNSAYFESLCSDDPSTKWLLRFVDDHCPASMSQDFCALSASKKATCDTSCSNLDSECCPSETLCLEGTHLGCPYHKCRVQILEELFAWVWWIHSYWSWLSCVSVGALNNNILPVHGSKQASQSRSSGRLLLITVHARLVMFLDLLQSSG